MDEPLGKDRALIMAVRHEVENLIRRGNIFYWRARIPAVFVHCRPGSRLSLSLHCSDHRKAQMIGRKLNTRLAELKMNLKDVMTTKKQLQILLEHVRDQELERLDDISTMAKRNGRGGDVVEMELDLEAGWACQLLAKFGTRPDLSLEGDCPGLTYLLKNGVPASHVDMIRTNYLAELTIARSAGFEDGIRRLIYQFDIADTAVNRERAMSKMFEGRAAALLDIDDRHELVDRNLSEFTGGGRANKSVVEEKPAEVEPATPPLLVLAKGREPAPTATAIPQAEEIAYLDLSPRVAPTTKNAVLEAQQPNQRIVAVADFEQECEKLIAQGMGAGNGERRNGAGADVQVGACGTWYRAFRADRAVPHRPAASALQRHPDGLGSKQPDEDHVGAGAACERP